MESPFCPAELPLIEGLREWKSAASGVQGICIWPKRAFIHPFNSPCPSSRSDRAGHGGEGLSGWKSVPQCSLYLEIVKEVV